MNVLVINPPNIPFTNPGILIEPIDVLTIATSIQSQDFSVSILDMDVRKMLTNDLKSYLENKNFSHVIIVYDYHIPLHTNEAFNEILHIAQTLKNAWMQVILVGKIATYKPELVLKENSPIDICIQHEAETSLGEILKLKSLDKKLLSKISNIAYFNNGVIKTKSENLQTYTSLPIPDRSLVDLNAYIDVRTILSSRWCNRRCSFCHVPGFWGAWKARSAESVVEEIAYLINEYNAQKILFLDDNTTVDSERMKQISEGIIKKWLTIKLWCLGSLKNFNQEMMEMMYQAGFRWIHYGIETGDEKVAQKINKPLTQTEVLSTIEKTKKIWFRIRTSRILDLEESILDKTLDLIKQIQTEEIRLHFLALRYGSDIYIKRKSSELSSQYIHRPNTQNDSPVIKKGIASLIKCLENAGYQTIREIKENNNIQTWQKLVSLCPLKYWINW